MKYGSRPVELRLRGFRVFKGVGFASLSDFRSLKFRVHRSCFFPAGFLGRWRNQLCSRINGSGRAFNDAAVAPVIRQTLLHWAYELTEFDWELWFTRG